MLADFDNAVFQNTIHYFFPSHKYLGFEDDRPLEFPIVVEFILQCYPQTLPHYLRICDLEVPSGL